MKTNHVNKSGLGLWLIGAYGGISTCVTAGLAGIRRGIYDTTGLVSELDDFRHVDLVPLEDIVVGGCDVRDCTVLEAAQSLEASSHIIGEKHLETLRDDLAKVEEDVEEGTLLNSGEAVEQFSAVRPDDNGTHLEAITARVQDGIRRFQAKHALRDVIVVNIASAEAFSDAGTVPRTPGELRDAIEADRKEVLSSGILYAYAAIDAGYPYINFSPSISAEIPAIMKLAEERRVPHMGKDGKTGETLVKTVLAPMFAARNLKVLSWISHNILGNRDGRVLADSRNAKAKLENKAAALQNILNDPDIDSQVRIDYVPSLDDWKTAWDFIHFRGFMDTRMIMQFTWQGCDSALAAPLVIDLARFIEHAHRKGAYGVQKQLACFFKVPTGVDEQDFVKQYHSLRQYTNET